MAIEAGDSTRGIMTVLARHIVVIVVLVSSVEYSYNLVGPDNSGKVFDQILYEVTGIEQILHTSSEPVKIQYLNERAEYDEAYGGIKVGEHYISKIVQEPEVNLYQLDFGWDTVNFQKFNIFYNPPVKDEPYGFRLPMFATVNRNDRGLRLLAQKNEKFPSTSTNIVFGSAPETGKCIETKTLDYSLCSSQTEDTCGDLSGCRALYDEDAITYTGCVAEPCGNYNTNRQHCVFHEGEVSTPRDYCRWEGELCGPLQICEEGIIFEKQKYDYTINQESALIIGENLDEYALTDVFSKMKDFIETPEEDYTAGDKGTGVSFTYSLPPNFFIAHDSNKNEICMYKIIQKIDTSALKTQESDVDTPNCERESKVSGKLVNGISVDGISVSGFGGNLISSAQEDISWLTCCGFNPEFNQVCLDTYGYDPKWLSGTYTEHPCGTDKYGRLIYQREVCTTVDGDCDSDNKERKVFDYESGAYDGEFYNVCAEIGCNWFEYPVNSIGSDNLNKLTFGLMGEESDVYDVVKQFLIPNFRNCINLEESTKIPANYWDSLSSQSFAQDLAVSELSCFKPREYDSITNFILPPIVGSDADIEGFSGSSIVKIFRHENGQISTYGVSQSLALQKVGENYNAYFGWTDALRCGTPTDEFNSEKGRNRIVSISEPNYVVADCVESITKCIVDKGGFPINPLYSE